MTTASLSFRPFPAEGLCWGCIWKCVIHMGLWLGENKAKKLKECTFGGKWRTNVFGHRNKNDFFLNIKIKLFLI
jgi:hypothetical protein